MMTRQLTPSEAVRQFDEDPSGVVFPLVTFRLQFGLTERELLKELQTGRLLAHTMPSADVGVRDVVITAEAMINWMAHPRTPPRLLEKVRGHLAEARRQRLAQKAH
jgi:DTW domain-containing protein YfiP